MFGFIFFITFSLIGAQTITIVDAQTNTPIQNVYVYADSVVIISDHHGTCSIDTFKQNDQITFSMIGYKTIRLPYKRISKIIYLEKELIPMELVTIFGKNKKSKKRYTRLEKNVRKVYPYALKISDMLID